MTRDSYDTSKRISHSFGFDPAESQHHFVVTIQRASTQKVEISEHFTWDSVKGSSEVTYTNKLDGQVRAVLVRPKWDAIADEVRAHFNQRLKKIRKKAGAWRTGPNLVRKELGKELVLLAWAIEDADPGLVSNAVANWKGLVAEERWWLYTQTAAATGHGTLDRGKGWRKALRFALSENPAINRSPDDLVVPEFFRLASESDLDERPKEADERDNES
ncbi:MAG: DUF3780 domain-containing protein [bacterium]|nr:DUF3780 domain-containing protein [bacterium]